MPLEDVHVCWGWYDGVGLIMLQITGLYWDSCRLLAICIFAVAVMKTFIPTVKTMGSPNKRFSWCFVDDFVLRE